MVSETISMHLNLGFTANLILLGHVFFGKNAEYNFSGAVALEIVDAENPPVGRLDGIRI